VSGQVMKKKEKTLKGGGSRRGGKRVVPQGKPSARFWKKTHLAPNQQVSPTGVLSGRKQGTRRGGKQGQKKGKPPDSTGRHEWQKRNCFWRGALPKATKGGGERKDKSNTHRTPLKKRGEAMNQPNLLAGRAGTESSTGKSAQNFLGGKRSCKKK